MAAKDLGTKYTCFKCSTRFYDLKKPDPLCPKCGADQRESPALKPPDKAERRKAAAARPILDEPVLEEEAVDEEEEDLAETPEEPVEDEEEDF
jgi:uncharacterized protein (TIGR02300 family)